MNNARGVAGTVAVGTVSKSADKRIADGATVLVSANGVWNDNVVVPASSVFSISSKLSAEQAGQVDLVASALAVLSGAKEGDIVLIDEVNEALNAAISAVAKHLKIKVVHSEKGQAKVENVKIGVTSLVGEQFNSFAKQVSVGGTVVSVNSAPSPLASAAGVSSGVAAFIFNNKTIRGFDFSAWASHNSTEAARTINEASTLLSEGKISLAAVKTVAQTDFLSSISAASQGKVSILKISK